jgi:hypothetical protein
MPLTFHVSTCQDNQGNYDQEYGGDLSSYEHIAYPWGVAFHTLAELQS